MILIFLMVLQCLGLTIEANFNYRDSITIAILLSQYYCYRWITIAILSRQLRTLEITKYYKTKNTKCSNRFIFTETSVLQIEGLVKDYCNSFTFVKELQQSFTKPSKCPEQVNYNITKKKLSKLSIVYTTIAIVIAILDQLSIQ